MMLKITMLKIMIIVMIIIMMMKTAILIINEDNNFKEGSDYINASWIPGFLIMIFIKIMLMMMMVINMIMMIPLRRVPTTSMQVGFQDSFP